MVTSTAGRPSLPTRPACCFSFHAVRGSPLIVYFQLLCHYINLHTNIDREVETVRVQSHGRNIGGNQDACTAGNILYSHKGLFQIL